MNNKKILTPKERQELAHLLAVMKAQEILKKKYPAIQNPDNANYHEPDTKQKSDNKTEMENQIKPDWITDKQWSIVPSVGWWEDCKKRAESMAQWEPVTPEEALAQTVRLRNSKNWNQGE